MKTSRKNKYLTVITHEDPISKKEQISVTIPPFGFDPDTVSSYLRENPRPAQLSAHDTLREIKKAVNFEDVKKRHAYRTKTSNHMGPCYYPDPLDEDAFNTTAMGLIEKIEKLQLEATSTNSIPAGNLDELVGYSIRLGIVFNEIKMRKKHLTPLANDRKRRDAFAYNNEGRTSHNIERKKDAQAWQMAVRNLIMAKPSAFHAKKTREKANILEKDLKKMGYCRAWGTIENYIRNLK